MRPLYISVGVALFAVGSMCTPFKSTKISELPFPIKCETTIEGEILQSKMGYDLNGDGAPDYWEIEIYTNKGLNRILSGPDQDGDGQIDVDKLKQAIYNRD